MFEGVESTVSDLLLFQRSSGDIPLRVSLPGPAVARAILQIASGKIPESNGQPVVGALDADAIVAAQHFVASQFLAPGADHFRTLGLSRDADTSAIRDHFRRMMGLVHPDSNPVGYPDDAAIRVNRAYTVLSSDENRAQYLASLSADSLAAPSSATRSRTDSDGHGARWPRSTVAEASLWRRWSDRLRARHNLLILAALLVLPAIWFSFAGLGSEAPVRLVESSRRAVAVAPADGDRRPPPATAPLPVPSSDAPGSVAAVLPATATSRSDDVRSVASDPTTGTSVQAKPVPTTATTTTNAVGSQRPRTGAPPTPCTTGNCAIALAQELSVRSMGLVAARTAQSLAPMLPSPVATPPTTPPAAAAAATVLSGPAGSTPPAAAPTPPRDNTRAPGQPGAVPPPSSTATPHEARVPEATTASSPTPVRSTDAEELLVRFSSAYEAGSLPAFAQLFSTSMAGRRQLLNEYERVFFATRSRAIKFGQLKQSVLGDRLSVAGYATVTTVDSDNRASTQRVFLEFEIARERGEPRIDRLANYAMN